ncbi:MAG TPA: energy transducer TonB [Saprospiraceae bacterium]|nr:energy transducer TonB [Saprospiraceae bacterium]
MFKGLEFSGTTVGLALLGLVLVTLGTIFFLRNRFKGQLGSLTEKYMNKKWKSPLAARTKYPDVDSFSFYRPFLLWGLLGATATTLFALNWTQRDAKVYIPEDAMVFEEEIEIEQPRTAEPPPPPPPPPPPVITEVPDEEAIEDQPEFVDQTVEEDERVIAEPVKEEKKAPPPPPPPPPPAPKTEDIFKVVEQMPRFPGCESAPGDNKAKEACAREKLLQYIYKNVKYPPIARENGVEGTTVVQFTVGKKGEIEDIVVLRDPGAGLGDSAKDVVDSMNKMGEKWTPGKQRGQAVKVQHTLPIKFKLQD